MNEGSPALRSALSHVGMHEARIVELRERVEIPREGDVSAETLDAWLRFDQDALANWTRIAASARRDAVEGT